MSSTLRARNTPAVDTDRVDPVPAYTANDLRVDAQDAERTRLYTPHIPASDDRFFTAIRANDITLVTQLLDENPLLVHSHDPSIPRVTALYAAVDSCLNGSARGKTFIVALLAERGADVNGISSTGNYHPSPSRRYSTRVPGKLIERTPLMAAAEAGSLPLVRLLYEDLHADDGIVAPDGEIALRLAVRNQHRDIVQLLPTRRRGGWRRFRHQHQIAMYRINRAGKAIYHFFKFFVWEVPKFFLWTLPKWVVWPIIKGLFWELPKYLWKKLVAFVKAIPGAVVKGYNATVDGVVKGYEAVKGFVPRIPHLAANAARAVWNGLKKLGHSIWEFLKSIPGVINDMLQAIWKMLKATPQFCWNVVKAIGRFIRGVVKGIWWITKETTLWFWKLFTQTIPQLLLSIGRFIIRAFVSLGHFTLDFLTKIASLVDTVFNAIITRLRAVTLADIGRALYAVVVSVPIWLWESFLNVCEAIRKGTVWTLEQMGTFVHFMAELIFALIMYVPTKTAEIALAVGHIAAAGGREVARWVSPKSNI